jgi:hypothetical protein
MNKWLSDPSTQSVSWYQDQNLKQTMYEISLQRNIVRVYLLCRTYYLSMDIQLYVEFLWNEW